ncbi:MAG: CsbD family protein [Verrucomicrobiota bacterium]|nr:CsbD family protein [Verrucomicrobiota bacterium]
MKSGNNDKLTGTLKKAKGTVKEKVGRATGNGTLEARGAGEKLEGKAQNKMGDVKKVFGK